MKLLDIFKKNVKTVEENEKELQAIREELARVQEDISEKQTQQGQLNSAIKVVSAHLVIDPKDAEANKKKEQAEKKLAQLSKEIEILSQKQAELQAQESEAQKTVGQSKGEVFKQERVRKAIAGRVTKTLADELQTLGKKTQYSHGNWEDWAEAYGYPVHKQPVYSPLYGSHTKSTRKEIVDRDKVVPKLREHQAEVDSVAEEKAKEISDKVMEYTKKLFKDEGIELDK
ncbi:hypothetical protein ABES25_06095 [Bacillus gobiensis]|uniref:hypothetical protein n=1 Tax=Bacillus gobiensis TaxID=1441095 RepID=UPI003D213EF0